MAILESGKHRDELHKSGKFDLDDEERRTCLADGYRAFDLNVGSGSRGFVPPRCRKRLNRLGSIRCTHFGTS